MQSKPLLLLFSAYSVTIATANPSPLSEVTTLLKDLSAKITQEGTSEDKAFKEYTRWCEDVSTNRKFDIKTATSEKEKLEAAITELTASIEASSSKIGSLASDISTATADLKSARAMREKEASDFAASDKELVEVIDTLRRAITILEREMQKNPAAFTQVAGTGISGIVRTLSQIADAAAFSTIDTQRLMSLVQSRQDVDDADSDLGAPAADAYKTHSQSIFDVLEDLKEKAEAQLSDIRKAEVNAKHNFQMLSQSIEDQLGADNKDLIEEKNAKSSAQESKATADGDLTKTTGDLKVAEEALSVAAATCKQVEADHAATVAAREEELKVIADAIEVLKSSTPGAASKTYSFVQLRSSGNSRVVSKLRTVADLARSEVVALIKKLAREQHSSALAQLASRVAAVVRFGAGVGEDPFAKVKNLIQDMIDRLQSEAGAEATEKSFCDEEIAKTATKKNELGFDIAKLTSKIDKAVARSTELKGEVQDLQGELASMAREQAEMDEIRKTSHADFVQAKADLEQGLSGVRKALVILRDYYGNQDSAGALLQVIPEAPRKFEKASGSGTSIIGLLEVVQSDFATNLAREETEEATAQEDYEKVGYQNKITKASMEQSVKYKSEEFASLDRSVSELSSDRETANDELAAVLEYDEKVKARCIAKPQTYEERKQRREAEISGLKEALTILEGDAAFIQRKGKSRGNRMRGSAKLAM